MNTFFKLKKKTEQLLAYWAFAAHSFTKKCITKLYWQFLGADFYLYSNHMCNYHFGYSNSIIPCKTFNLALTLEKVEKVFGKILLISTM